MDGDSHRQRLRPPDRRGGRGQGGAPAHRLPVAAGADVYTGRRSGPSSACEASSAGADGLAEAFICRKLSSDRPTEAEALNACVFSSRSSEATRAVLVPIFQAPPQWWARQRPLPRLRLRRSGRRPAVRQVATTCATSRSRARRDRGDRPPRRPVERSAERPRPALTYDIITRQRPPGAPGPRRGRASLPLLVLLQQLRGRGRRPPRRDVAPAAGDALRRIEGARRAGPRRPRRPVVHRGLPAQRDRLRRLPPPALRCRPEQPRGLGSCHGRRPPQERRHAVAADRPHPGHRPGLPPRPRRTAGGGGRGRLQHRGDGRELPGSRPGPDRGRRGPGLQRRDRPRRLAGRPQLPRPWGPLREAVVFEPRRTRAGAPRSWRRFRSTG